MANGTILTLSCIDCGGSFEFLFRNGNLPKRCLPCKAEAKRVSNRETARKHRERFPKPRVDMSIPLICEQCGRQFDRSTNLMPPRKCPICRYFGKYPPGLPLGDNAPRSARCLDCGTPLSRTGGRRRRCLEHWLAHEIEMNRAVEVARIRPSKAKPAPPLRKCLDCDEQILKSFTKWPKRCPKHAHAYLNKIRRDTKTRRVQTVRDSEPDPKCIDCGTNVPRRTYGRQIRRCGECRRERWNRQSRETRDKYLTARMAAEKRWRQAHPDVLRANVRRRQARRRGATTVEVFDNAEIFERDRWICQICKRKVNQKLKFPHRLSASLDHVIPLSQGGQHTRANTRLAHFRCNCSRRDRGGNEQLALIG